MANQFVQVGEQAPQLGHYRLIRVLGQGAFATVYLGKHLHLERLAALKVLHMRMEPTTYERFRHEACTIALLRHPHIIEVHDFGIENQTPYLVMEYMPNGTLRSQYPKGTRLPFEQIVTYARQLASSLDYAHERHVVHRDVKPENLLLGSNHEVVLSDFGIAILQRTLDTLPVEHSAGTPIYMAPEQIQHMPGPASDQYALGVMVYEWLCGEPPFGGPLFEVLSQHIHKTPPSLCARIEELPPAVEDTVMRALAKDPKLRFANVTDFASALQKAFSVRQRPSLSASTIEHTPDVLQPLPSLSPQAGTPGQKQATQTRKQVLLQEQNRKRMLQRLRRTYEELFAQSLHGVMQMELGLADKAGAVQNASTLLFQTSTHPEQLLPPGTSILHVYDQATQELLILGAAGAGKSTLLVELARQLVARADTDETQPLPVILPLTCWAVKRSPLQIWLAGQVAEFYDIPQVLAQRWIDEDQLLPLLDGLDEMEEAARPACIAAINAYHRDHLRLPLVVCSRQAEYEQAANHQRLALQNAVVVQPLTHEHVQAYLAQMGKSSTALRHVLTTNPALAEVATTPLMVHLLTLTYQGTSVQQLSTQYEQLQQQIWTDYLTRVVERRCNEMRYPLKQMRAWLSWLARQMRQHNQTVFYLEHLQPDWLTDRQHRVYNWLGVRLPAMMIGVLVSIIIGSFLFNISQWPTLPQMVIAGVVLGGLLCPMVRRHTPQAATKIHRRWGRRVLISIGVGSVIALSQGWGFNYNAALSTRLSFGLVYGVIFGLLCQLFQYILPASPRSPSPIFTTSSGPRTMLMRLVQQWHFQRALLLALLIWLSVALSYCFSYSLSIGLIHGLSGGLTYGLRTGLIHGLSGGLTYGLCFGVIIGLTSVLLEYLQDAIYLAERVNLSWRKLCNRLFAFSHLMLSLMLTGCIILFSELSNRLNLQAIFRLSINLSNGWGYGLSLGLLYWLLLSICQSIGQEGIEDKDRRVPNQGMRQSLRNSLLLGLISGTIIGGMGMLAYGLNLGLSEELSHFSFLFATSCILVWAMRGGLAVWRHYLIRFLLRRAQTFPWNAIH